MERIEDFDGIAISDYGKGLLTRNLIQTIIKRAKKSKKLIMVDPKVKNVFFYKGATVNYSKYQRSERSVENPSHRSIIRGENGKKPVEEIVV